MESKLTDEELSKSGADVVGSNPTQPAIVPRKEGSERAIVTLMSSRNSQKEIVDASGATSAFVVNRLGASGGSSARRFSSWYRRISV